MQQSTKRWKKNDLKVLSEEMGTEIGEGEGPVEDDRIKAIIKNKLVGFEFFIASN